MFLTKTHSWHLYYTDSGDFHEGKSSPIYNMITRRDVRSWFVVFLDVMMFGGLFFAPKSPKGPLQDFGSCAQKQPGHENQIGRAHV